MLGVHSVMSQRGSEEVSPVLDDTHTDPRVLQSLLGSDSLSRVNSQHLVDEIFGLWSHRVPLWGGKLNPTRARPHMR